jgi:hypothetical protein
MSRNITCAAIAALATAAFANTAAADTHTLTQALQPAGAAFEALDKNSDGKVSMDEASAIDKLFTVFKRLDTNKDGVLSREEYAAYDPAAPKS